MCAKLRDSCWQMLIAVSEMDRAKMQARCKISCSSSGHYQSQSQGLGGMVQSLEILFTFEDDGTSTN